MADLSDMQMGELPHRRNGMSPEEIAREIVQKAICTNIHTGKEWLAEGYGYPDLLRAAIASALSTERTAREKAEAEVRRLQERLEMTHAWVDGERVEVEPGSIPDGIECRDDTIKILTENNDRLRVRAEKAEAERDEWKLRAGNAEPWRLYDAAIARAEKAEAALGLAWQDGHHDGYADGCKAAREAALREAAEFIRVQRNETPATGEEFAVALLSLIPKQEGET